MGRYECPDFDASDNCYFTLVTACYVLYIWQLCQDSCRLSNKKGPGLRQKVMAGRALKFVGIKCDNF